LFLYFKCATLDTDAQNCGACGHACGAGEVCTGGVCQFTCPAGQNMCFNQSGPYCVASFQTDGQNCGSCGHACGTNEVCTDGYCQFACPSGQNMCFNQSGPYCVASFQTDSRNCGSCGHACGTNETCTNGFCLPWCPAGTTMCGGPAGVVCTWLWRSDGTASGTTHVAAAPAAAAAGSLVGRALLGSVGDATHGPGVLASDRTEAGTQWLPVKTNERASISGSL